MLYEIATLGGSVFASYNALAGARDWVSNAAAGTLLGIWRTDIGRVGDLIVLRF